MNYTLEKTERYALVRLNESNFADEHPATLEKLAASFFREGYSSIIVEMASSVSIDAAGVIRTRLLPGRGAITEKDLADAVEPLLAERAAAAH